MKRLSLIILLISALNTSFGQWDYMGTPGLSAVASAWLDFEEDNNNYYACYNESGNVIYVKSFNGTDWQALGGQVSDGAATYVDMEIHLGSVYVLYRDLVNGNGLTMKMYNGTSWVAVGPQGFTPGSAEHASFCFNSSNQPFVAFKDATQSNRLSVMRYNGFSWQYLGTPGFSAAAADGCDIEQVNDTLYVAYKDWDVFSTSVMMFNGTDWQLFGTQGFTDNAFHQELSVDSQGMLYLAISSWAANSSPQVFKYSGGNWSQVGGDLSTGEGLYPRVEFYNDEPYAFFVDNVNSGRVAVQKFDGTNWISFAGGFASQDSSTFMSAKIANDHMYVIFTDDSVNMRTSVRRYCFSADQPVLGSMQSMICQGDSVQLYIQSGNLNAGSTWVWTTDSCTNFSIGTGDSIYVNPSSTTTYIAFGVGGCLADGPCDSTIITVNSFPDTSVTISGNNMTVQGVGTYQWYDCLTWNSVAGATTQSFVPPTNGPYAVVVDNGCVDTSSCHAIADLSVLESELQLNIFPNPSTGIFQIRSNKASMGTVRIIDLSGKVVTSFTLDSDLIQFEIETKGAYILEYQDERGTIRKRLVRH